MPEYVPCSECGEEITPDSDFCPHCGVMYDGNETAQCEKHPDRNGTALCIICRRVLCEKCTCTSEGRRFCNEHESVRVEQDWAVVFESPDPAEAKLVKSFFDSVGQKSLVREFTPYGLAWDGGGHGDFSLHMINRAAAVFIPIPDFLDARKSLDEWKSGRVEDQ